jgi:hypothetical protein
VVLVIEAEEREESSGKVWPWDPFLPFDPTRYDKVDLWQDFLAGLCKDLLVKPLCQFEKK